MKRMSLSRKAPLRRRTKIKLASKYRPTTKELDALCREVVFLRDGGVCQKGGCEPSRPKQWCHVRSRRYRSTRWDPINSLVLCAGHHLWNHHEPAEFVDWFRDKFPVRAALLKLKSQTSGSGKVDLAAIKLFLEAERSRLTAGVVPGS